MRLGCHGFRKGLGRVTFVIKGLSLQIRGLDIIAVGDHHRAHARADQRFGGETAQRAASGDHRPGMKETLLARFAKRCKKHLPGIFFKVRCGHVLIISLEPVIRAWLLFLLAGVVSMFAAAQTVREVRFDPTDPGERYRDRLALQPGQPFDANAVRESIARLYATGRFAEIEVDSSAGIVTFRTKPNYFIGAVTASGLNDNPTPVQAVNTAKLQLGELYSDTKRDQAVSAITRLLQFNG